MNDILEKIRNILSQLGFDNLCNETVIGNNTVYTNVSVNEVQTGSKEFFYHVSMSTIIINRKAHKEQEQTLYNTNTSQGKKNYKFDKNGRYKGSEESQDPNQKEHQGYSEELEEFFTFADPINDPIALDTTTIYKPQIIISTDSIIFSILEKSGVYKEENRGLIDGIQYLLNESDASNLEGGAMDYAGGGEHFIDTNGATFYITKTKSGTVAHNGYNYGNFLWGAGANALGIPEWMAKLGAHYNNYVNDPYHKGKLDSKDDQYSIGLGYEWKRKSKWEKAFEKLSFEEKRKIYIKETNGTTNIWVLDIWNVE
jgi:hypothetical protein